MENLLLLMGMSIPALLVMGCLVLWRARRRRDTRRSPLNMKVLNVPGEQLRKRMAEHAEAYDNGAVLAMMLGPIFLAVWLFLKLRKIDPDLSSLRPGWGDAVVPVAGLALLAWCVRELIRHGAAWRRCREGLAAELAVAQSLMPLLADGALVFHDFPADGFNIDHIVIGRGVVFALETKSRKKPASGGKESARVVYDGKLLRFPTHSETKPLDQAKAQAQWLERFVSSGVGEPVRVIPVVVLPGWFVELTVPRPDVLVMNPRNPVFLNSEKFGPSMGDAMRKRIAHVLSERYPPFDP